MMSNTAEKQDTPDHNHAFETDVSRLLDIVANALYSNRDVFLRELISNAADACDRLRYAALTDKSLRDDSQPFAIHIKINREDNKLIIIDNGIGMDRDDLVENLGTIARSGTAAILENLKQSGDDKDMNLIGQFGVGFYASFMVANKVRVISQKAGSDQPHAWESDGKTGYNLEPASNEDLEHLENTPGTCIIFDIKNDGRKRRDAK